MAPFRPPASEYIAPQGLVGLAATTSEHHMFAIKKQTKNNKKDNELEYY